MRILVISDIHANLAAFEAVLEDAAGKWEQIWCLGDVIGYGPNPNECVALLREHNHICLTGNHDWAALDKLDISDFNPEATTAVHWTRRKLNEESRAYLAAQPPIRTVDDYMLVHASPREPVWEYIFDAETAVDNFPLLTSSVCLVGHTHVPVLFAEQDEFSAAVYRPTFKETIVLDVDMRVIINPGSVGQPRDNDPRAAYALLDTEARSWEFHRVAYPVHITQNQMRAQGLPEPLAFRLEYGW